MVYKSHPTYPDCTLLPCHRIEIREALSCQGLRYKIALHHSDEGYSVSVPGLPGCWFQGQIEVEVLANIETAIREYFSVVEDLLENAEVREIELAV